MVTLAAQPAGRMRQGRTKREHSQSPQRSTFPGTARILRAFWLPPAAGELTERQAEAVCTARVPDQYAHLNDELKDWKV
jgi:hypothetical protein